MRALSLMGLGKKDFRVSQLFDAYITVDWSSKSSRSPARPSRDAIWVGERRAFDLDSSTSGNEIYFRTRMECRSHIYNRLLHHLRHGRRVFLGFDFAYGYPAGFASALELDRTLPPWRAVWDELTRLITDEDDNSNNRFEVASGLNARCEGHKPGPLWGRPASLDLPDLSTTSPGFPYESWNGTGLERLRQVELQQRNAKETWKVFYAGSVGGQTLTGIPVVCELRDDPELSRYSRVWPFETGFTATPTPHEGPFVLHAEIFPSNLPGSLEEGLIQDRAQVRAVARWLSETDEVGELGSYFATPRALSPERIEACLQEEGWILGS